MVDAALILADKFLPARADWAASQLVRFE